MRKDVSQTKGESLSSLAKFRAVVAVATLLWLTAAGLWLITPDRTFEVYGLLQFLVALVGVGLALVWSRRVLEFAASTTGISVACLFVGRGDPGQTLLALEFAFGWLLVAVIQSFRTKPGSETDAD